MLNALPVVTMNCLRTITRVAYDDSTTTNATSYSEIWDIPQKPYYM